MRLQIHRRESVRSGQDVLLLLLLHVVGHLLHVVVVMVVVHWVVLGMGLLQWQRRRERREINRMMRCGSVVRVLGLVVVMVRMLVVMVGSCCLMSRVSGRGIDIRGGRRSRRHHFTRGFLRAF